MIRYLLRLLSAHHMNVANTTVTVKVVTGPVQRQYVSYTKMTLAYYIQRRYLTFTKTTLAYFIQRRYLIHTNTTLA